MTKLIQICASQNDLFGLDGEGVVYQFNFNTNSWMRIGRGRNDSEDSPLVEHTSVFVRPNSHGPMPPDGDARVERRE
jgi:hypothetical protein